MVHLGRAIRLRREALGLSQARLASLAHLSRATINGLESGSTDLGIAKVLTIARILDLSLGFIDESSRHGGWLETAAASASVSYRKPMPAAVLARAIRTGSVDEEYKAHMATFLDEASPAILVRAVAGAFPGSVPKSAWRNVVKLARATMSSRDELR